MLLGRVVWWLATTALRFSCSFYCSQSRPPTSPPDSAPSPTPLLPDPHLRAQHRHLPCRCSVQFSPVSITATCGEASPSHTWIIATAAPRPPPNPLRHGSVAARGTVLNPEQVTLLPASGPPWQGPCRTQASLDSSPGPAVSSLVSSTTPALLHRCDQTHTCSSFLTLLLLPSVTPSPENSSPVGLLHSLENRPPWDELLGMLAKNSVSPMEASQQPLFCPAWLVWARRMRGWGQQGAQALTGSESETQTVAFQ